MFNPNIATLILMGGQNKRMNGQHKALLTIENKTFLEHITDNMKDFSTIYLSVNPKNLFDYLSYPIIIDNYDSIGPIGGIYSALQSISEDYLFVTGCDMPYISSTFASFMQNNLTTNTTCFALYDEDGFYYPLGAIYSKNALPYLKSFIDQGCYSLQRFIKESPSQSMVLSQTPFTKEIFTNINTPEEYHLFIGFN